MRLEFLQNIHVDGVPVVRGTVMDRAQIPAGCVESMLYTGAVREVASEQPKNDPKPVAKKAS